MFREYMNDLVLIILMFCVSTPLLRAFLIFILFLMIMFLMIISSDCSVGHINQRALLSVTYTISFVFMCNLNHYVTDFDYWLSIFRIMPAFILIIGYPFIVDTILNYYQF